MLSNYRCGYIDCIYFAILLQYTKTIYQIQSVDIIIGRQVIHIYRFTTPTTVFNAIEILFRLSNIHKFGKCASL